MDQQTITQRRELLLRLNAEWTAELLPVDRSLWPADNPENQVAAWRSCDFIVLVFSEGPGLMRMCVCRAKLNDDGKLSTDISWEDLQAIKNRCGFGDYDAVEIYPAAGNEVVGDEMRHIWIMDERISFAWRRELPIAVVQESKEGPAAPDGEGESNAVQCSSVRFKKQYPSQKGDERG